MLHKKNDTLDLIVYRDTGHPLSYKVNSKTYQRILVITPIIVLLALAAIFFSYVFTENIMEKYQGYNPDKMAELQESLKTSQAEIQELTNINKDFERKMSMGVPNITSLLNIFQMTPGFTNLSKVNRSINVESFKLERSDSGIRVRFNVVNEKSDNTRISGYIFVILRTNDSILLYPSAPELYDDFLVKYTDGESFGASRFRPVDAKFKTNALQDKKINAETYIFSRTGDLLFSGSLGKES